MARREKENYRKIYQKMDDPAYFDYIVAPKVQGALLRRRVLLVFGYVFYVLAFSTLCMIFHLYPVMCLVLVTTLILIFFTWRYVSPEYLYSIYQAHVSLAVIYGGVSRKELGKYHIKDFEVIAPYGAASSYFDEADEKRVFVSSMKDLDIYVFLMREGDKTTAILLNVPDEALRKFRYYNDRTVLRDGFGK